MDQLWVRTEEGVWEPEVSDPHPYTSNEIAVVARWGPTVSLGSRIDVAARICVPDGDECITLAALDVPHDAVA
ncbi:MAG: hypothetical protein KY469_02160 [Actinobacteria bacterium]|nr:hypothetical protein [Actinomycetota bacterium]